MFAKGKFVDATLNFPFSKAAPKITLSAGRCLVAFLSSFGEQLHDHGRYRRRDIFQTLVRRYRLPRDMAVNPLHGIGGSKGKTSGEHFIKGDAERIEIAPGIYGTIHSSGLFRCHVGECSGDELRRFGPLALARKARSDPKAHEPDLAGRGVHENIVRFDVLVDQTSLV